MFATNTISGSKDAYLNELTSIYTQKQVITGALEAIAMGNLKTQFEFFERE